MTCNFALLFSIKFTTNRKIYKKTQRMVLIIRRNLKSKTVHNLLFINTYLYPKSFFNILNEFC